MITTEQVREELKRVKIYYSRKDAFDRAERTDRVLETMKLVDKYAALIFNASDKLYIVYDAIYIQGLTQEACADKLFYSLRYVQRLHSELVKYFSTELNKKGTNKS